jgi:hypothetical protein
MCKNAQNLEITLFQGVYGHPIAPCYNRFLALRQFVKIPFTHPRQNHLVHPGKELKCASFHWSRCVLVVCN